MFIILFALDFIQDIMCLLLQFLIFIKNLKIDKY